MVAARARATAMPRSLAWAIITIAFLFQALLLATHIHLSPRLEALGGVAWTVQVDKDDRHDHHQATGDCAICDAQQVAGHILPPIPFLLIVPAILAFVVAPRRATARVIATFCHHWRSRAPPRHS